MARYSRHLLLPEVGVEGQQKLKKARVLLVGAGGLGSPIALYLAAAGVGHLGLVDFDSVDTSNLQRQIIHGTRDVGRLKILSAQDRIHDINPHTEVQTFQTRFTRETALDIARNFDIVVDGTDNFPTRYLTNDTCVLLDKPNVHGSIFRFEGQASVFWAAHGACYRCLYPEPPPPGLVPSCAEGGVLGVLPGIVGCIQATETIKLILGVGDTLVNRLLMFDALKMTFRELRLRKNPECPICGEHPTIKEPIDYEAFCGLAPASARTRKPAEISVIELKRRLDRREDIQLIDVREPCEFAAARLAEARLIPLSQVLSRRAELDDARLSVIICRSGARSATAISQLEAAGFRGPLLNLRGGMIAWSTEIDSTLRVI